MGAFKRFFPETNRCDRVWRRAVSVTAAQGTKTKAVIRRLEVVALWDEASIRSGYANGRIKVNLNSNSKAPDALHRALLSRLTSRLLDSEDVEIVDVCHHTVVPSA